VLGEADWTVDAQHHQEEVDALSEQIENDRHPPDMDVAPMRIIEQRTMLPTDTRGNWKRPTITKF
jgi:hypothetical protein